MTSPSLYSVFDSFFDQYSIPVSSLSIPSCFLRFDPDNQDDASCLGVYSPSPAQGAVRWTHQGRWITFGIYRDEGRPTTNGVNFYENYVVFRLLPSLKLVPYSLIQQLFVDASPKLEPGLRSLVEITSGNTVRVPHQVTKMTDYLYPTAVTAAKGTLPLSRRWDQMYDESGAPLKLTYDSTGWVSLPHQIDSPYKNNPVMLASPIDGVVDQRVRVYDYYGAEINDPFRGPYFMTDLISRDPSVTPPVNNLMRKSIDGRVAFKGKLFDEFGNIVVGIQENNAVAVRRGILPLTLDVYNRPIKNPVGRA